MPRIPKSQQCRDCKLRRVKCDFNWPTCAPCQRAGLSCSGPPVRYKFIVNGRQSFYADETENQQHAGSSSSSSVPHARGPERSTGQPGTQDPDTRQRTVIAGNSRGPRSATIIRHFSHLLKQPARTSLDLLASRLVKDFENAPHSDVLIAFPYLRHLPRRLEESAALCEAMFVCCDAWSNYRRGLPPNQLIDPRMYGRALRTMQSALEGPRHLSVENLAAITVLQRMETVFDAGRAAHHTIHAGGILGILLKKGPPRLDDQLDVHLALENQGNLLSHWMLKRETNFFVRSPWREKLQQAAAGFDSEESVRGLTLNFLRISMTFGKWPELLHEVRGLYANPDREAGRTHAADLQRRVGRLLDEARSIGVPITQEIQKTGVVYEAIYPSFPGGVAYDFSDARAAQMALFYLTIASILTRMVYELGVYRRSVDETLWADYRRYGAEALKYVPSLDRRGMILSRLFVLSYSMAYEGVGEAEQHYLSDRLSEADSYLKRLPPTPDLVGQYMVYLARCSTGSQGFDLMPGRTETQRHGV